MELHQLPHTKDSRKAKKRKGQGHGSGNGKTSGRGHKGSGARSGYSTSPTFEGGQMPLARKLPHRGFNNARFRRGKEVAIVKLGDITRALSADINEVDRELLITLGLVKPNMKRVKILSDGEINRALKIKADLFSASAKEKILAAGGEAVSL